MLRSQSLIPSFVFWVLCFLITGYFAIHGLGLGGDTGYLSLSRLDKNIAIAKAELAELQTHRQWLEHRVSLMATDEVDADFLSELAREGSGLFAPNELIIDIN